MAFSISPNELKARYTVTLKMVHGFDYAGVPVEGTTYMEFCETFADVKARLRKHAAYLERGGEAQFHWVNDPSRWYAAAAQTARQRHQPFFVATSRVGTVSHWLTVVAL